MAALWQMTAAAAADGLARGAFSSRELVDAVLGRIEATEGTLRAYVDVDADSARAEALACDQRLAAGERRPLLGVPVAVKDNLNVTGQPCGCASRILRGYRSPYDAGAIARLRAAGAVLLGRTNMDEFAMGSTTENSSVAVTANPWNPACVPGGSSGGSAAAVAGGSALGALGSDTGGSVRLPASFCGCVGLKPSYGRVSRYGLVAYASSLDQIGPLARDVTDAALLLQAIAGPDDYDSTALRAEVPDYRASLGRDLRGLRLGLPREYFTDGMDREVEAAVRASVARCASLGAEIVEIGLPLTRYAIPAYYVIATAEASANLARFDGVRYGARVEGADPLEMYGRTRGQGFGDEVKRRIILGTYVLSSGYYDAYYLRAQKVRARIRAEFAEAFRSCDAIVTPTSPAPAYRIGEKSGDPLQMYLGDIFTVTANLAGICGISLPCGRSSAGLPIGLQILGPALGEETILRVAHAYEQSEEWHREHPGDWIAVPS